MQMDIKQSEHTTPSGIRLGNGLILLNLLNAILIPMFIFVPSSIFRIILVIPFLLFVPGYTLLAAIFVRKGEISVIEKVVFSIGLSLVIEVLIGLFLNYTSWGIRLEPVLYSICAFVFLISIVAWLRQGRLTKNERSGIELNLAWLNLGKRSYRVITIVLITAIFGAFASLTYIAATPKIGETFSEFYILGQPGKTGNYPNTLKIGDEGHVYVGIVNHERTEVSYSIKVLKSDNTTIFVGPLMLSDGQNWEGEVSFLATLPGENEKVEFMLYRDGEEQPYRELHLWINITE